MPTLKLYYGGWLTLPASLRQKLGLNTGDRLEVELIDGALVLRPYNNAQGAGLHEQETAGAPAADPDVAPVRRGPGRPRKSELAAARATPTPGPKRPRGRPRMADLTPAPELPAISEPWKLVKKADLQASSSGEEQVSPPNRHSARARSDAGAVERRPFRQVEVKKLGPGRGHNKRRHPAALAGQPS